MNQIEFYRKKLEFETDAWDVKEALKNGENIVLIDSRSEGDFVQERIRDAVNLPYRLMNESSTKNLDKQATYVVYCSGSGCNASTKGALKLTKLGFRVKELIGGLQWWKQNGYQTAGALTNIKTEETCNC